jgi:hypothetical protein
MYASARRASWRLELGGHSGSRGASAPKNAGRIREQGGRGRHGGQPAEPAPAQRLARRRVAESKLAHPRERRHRGAERLHRHGVEQAGRDGEGEHPVRGGREDLVLAAGRRVAHGVPLPRLPPQEEVRPRQRDAEEGRPAHRRSLDEDARGTRHVDELEARRGGERDLDGRPPASDLAVPLVPDRAQPRDGVEVIEPDPAAQRGPRRPADDDFLRHRSSLLYKKRTRETARDRPVWVPKRSLTRSQHAGTA